MNQTPAAALEQTLSRQLAGLEQRHLRRRRRPFEGSGLMLEAGGRTVVNFCSNDYLGLRSHPRITEALVAGAKRWGTGSGASTLISGYSGAHQAFEEELADFLQRPRALLFSTGYMANLALLSTIAGDGDWIVQDRLNHASLVDGARLSRATLLRYPHLDMEGLQRQLRRAESGQALLATESIYSMDGERAPLHILAAIAQDAGAVLMVDDAHGIGTCGEQGRGSVAAAGLSQEQAPLLVGTLGKAFGTFGAFVAGSEALIESLIQQSRSYIYTTAMPAAVAEAGRAALGLIRQGDDLRLRLSQAVQKFRTGAEQLNLPLQPSDSAIQPLIIGEAAAAVSLSEALLERGFLVSAIRPPTVPKGSSRLRITLSAAHSDQQIEQLLQAIDQCLPR